MSLEPDPEPQRTEPTHAFMHLTLLVAILTALGIVASSYAIFSMFSEDQ